MKKILLVCLIAICFLSSCRVVSDNRPDNGIYFNKVKEYTHVGRGHFDPYWVEREEFMKYYPVCLPVEIDDKYVRIDENRIAYPVKGLKTSEKQAYVEFILMYNFTPGDMEFKPTTIEHGWISFYYINDTENKSVMFSIFVSDHSYASTISVESESEKTTVINGVEMKLYDLSGRYSNGPYYYGVFMYNNLYFTCSFRNYSGDEVVGSLKKIVANS